MTSQKIETVDGDDGRRRKPDGVVAIKPGYLRKADAAKYLGISVRTLSKWMSERIIAFSKVSRRACLFRQADLDAAMGRFRVTAVGE